jgi:hypothetical protein
MNEKSEQDDIPARSIESNFCFAADVHAIALRDSRDSTELAIIIGRSDDSTCIRDAAGAASDQSALSLRMHHSILLLKAFCCRLRHLQQGHGPRLVLASTRYS